MTRERSKLSRHEGFKCRLGRVSRRPGTTQSVATPQRAVQTKNQGAHADVRKTIFFKGYSPIEDSNTCKPKSTAKSKDRMYIVDCGASLHMTGNTSFSLSTKRKPYDRPITTWTSKPRVASSGPEKRRGLHPEARHSLLREVGGRFAFGIVSWTIVRRIGVFLHSATTRTPGTNKRQEDNHVLYRQFGFSAPRSVSRR